jgi:hypothetical protein
MSDRRNRENSYASMTAAYRSRPRGRCMPVGAWVREFLTDLPHLADCGCGECNEERVIEIPDDQGLPF